MNIIFDYILIENLLIPVYGPLWFGSSYQLLDDTPEEIHRMHVNQ